MYMLSAMQRGEGWASGTDNILLAYNNMFPCIREHSKRVIQLCGGSIHHLNASSINTNKSESIGPDDPIIIAHDFDGSCLSSYFYALQRVMDSWLLFHCWFFFFFRVLSYGSLRSQINLYTLHWWEKTPVTSNYGLPQINK